MERDEVYWLRIDGAEVGPFITYLDARQWARRFTGQDERRSAAPRRRAA